MYTNRRYLLPTHAAITIICRIPHFNATYILIHSHNTFRTYIIVHIIVIMYTYINMCRENLFEYFCIYNRLVLIIL